MMRLGSLTLEDVEGFSKIFLKFGTLIPVQKWIEKEISVQAICAAQGCSIISMSFTKCQQSAKFSKFNEVLLH